MVLLLLHILDGIVQHISEQRTDLHIIHKIQLLSVRNDLQLDAPRLTVGAFGCQYRIQHVVPRFVLGLVDLDLPLHLIQVFQAFLRICLFLQKNDLMLQVMIFLVDHVDAFLRQLIGLVLHLLDVMKRVTLQPQLQLPGLKTEGNDQNDPGGIHQGPH